MDEILRSYYTDNAAKLRKVVDGILIKFGGLSDKDRDDFYSLANEVFVDVMQRYDHSQSFDAFLSSCLLRRIKTEMTRRNREKRRADRLSVSIDAPLGDEGVTVGDLLADDFDLEKSIIDGRQEGYGPKLSAYLGRLSAMQRKVLGLACAGYMPEEIRGRLHLSRKQYMDCHAAIHSYRNVSVLF